MKNLVVGISGINATDNPGPGIAIARSLKESQLDVTCIGLGYDANDPGHYLKWAIDKSYLLPFPNKGWKEMSERLRFIKNETGLDILIPCLDAELPLFLSYRDEIEKMGIRCFLPTEEQFSLRSKDRLDHFAEQIGCKYPKTVSVYSFEELYKHLYDSPEFPIMVKGKYYKAYKVYNQHSAIEKATEILSEWGYPLLIQKYVEGQEINLVGLGDGQGVLCGCVSIKKQTKTELGKVWTAVTIQDEQLLEVAKTFCKITKWRGPFELEGMRMGDDINLIEINPRFPAWVYFATAVGVNLPERMIHLMRDGQCDQSLDYPSGKHLVRYTHECLGDWDLFHDLVTLGGKDIE